MDYETNKILNLIKKNPCWELGNWDGCCCCDFSIRDVNFQISCGKGREKGVWVWSDNGDYHQSDEDHDNLLRPIAEEISAQCKECSTRSGDFPIHLFPPPKIELKLTQFDCR